ncbi:hypothetical protein ACQP06_11320 [Nocardia sp. CA-136227]|uniref:hypothetical protein n=1 Tax=Nocardia sp. CA-136227 TaxID=3239979 RepID=UPI003D96C48D
MSYDLDIWEADRTRSDADHWYELDRINEDQSERILKGAKPYPLPPSSKISDFTQALLRRWPEDEEDSPWSCGGAGDADGSFVCVRIQWGREDEVSAFVAGLAKVYGLVCHDRQTGRFRP